MVKNALLVALLAVGLSWVLGGCAASNGPCPVAAAGALAVDSSRQVVNGHNYYEGLVDNKEERLSRINLLRDEEDRMFLDDLDYLLLINHNSKLSEWHPGVLR
jgi:hypothetical protein